MNGTEISKQIDTRLVYGFPDAGKTTYIQDCVKNDRFYKRGYTLIFCFEDGETVYDETELTEKNTAVVYYSGGDVKEFCEGCIEAFRPDRIYVELNTGMPELREQLPECMKVTFAVTILDWSTFQVDYVTSVQTIQQMVSDSHQVVFRGCPSGKMLEPYSQAFRLMNPKASYLRQDPLGYHEKAFGLFVPFSTDDDEIEIKEKDYLPLWLDSFDHPDRYDGKTLHFTDPLEIRKNASDGTLSCGRVVMTCCMADLQFMSFEAERSTDDKKESAGTDGLNEGWYTFDAYVKTVADSYGQKKNKLTVRNLRSEQPPADLILDSRS